MVAPIPRYCVFKVRNTGKYLHSFDEGTLRGFQRGDGSNMLDPLSKLKVERANTTNKKRVHIKSCFNNKYWRVSSETDQRIVAAADAPEEDQTKWSSTLFEFDTYDNTVYKFKHVQSGKTIVFESNDQYNGLLILGETDYPYSFILNDWESLVILPKHVAFKAINGKFLFYRGDDDPHMEFGATDIGNNRVGDVIIPNGDGSICVRHDSNGKLWKADPNWIAPVADKDDGWSTRFQPIRLQGNEIALRSLLHARFLRITTYGGVSDCLAAASWANTIDKEAHLEIVELVKKRDIYDVVYRLQDAKVYDEKVLSVARSCVTNLTQNKQTMDVSMVYTKTWMYEWHNSSAIESNFVMGVSLGIPSINAEAKIEVTSSYDSEYQWSKTENGSQTLTKSISVDVPPMTKTTVNLLATLGSCDVPFSYTQQDVLTNGQPDSKVRDDGIFRGMNSYNFRTETTNQAL